MNRGRDFSDRLTTKIDGGVLRSRNQLLSTKPHLRSVRRRLRGLRKPLSAAQARRIGLPLSRKDKLALCGIVEMFVLAVTFRLWLRVDGLK